MTKVSAEARPCCMLCRRPMTQTGGHGRRSWACKGCKTCTRQRTSGEFKRHTKKKRVDVPARLCKKCGRQMWVGSLRKNGGHNYRCGHCAKLRTPEAKAADRRACQRQNPCCVTCQRMMHKARGRLGRLIFECVTCNFTVSHRPTPRALPPVWCLQCRRQMCGRKLLACWGCGVTCMPIVSAGKRRDGWRRGKATLAENRVRRLIETIDSLIPPYTLAHVREEARQAIVTDVLMGELRAAELTPKLVKGYVREGLGLSWHPGFISLDHLIGENLRLGDVLPG